MEILSNTEALSHCRQLSNLIDDLVKKSENGLLFSDYMNLVLYEPKLGYYTGGSIKFGSKGDFITAPEISPYFGASIAQTISPVIQHFRNGRHIAKILEFGAGSGALASSILLELQQLNTLPHVYQILEVSPDLQQRQQEHLHQFIKEHQIPVAIEWLTAMPVEFDGIILANEVIDAIPVDVIVKRSDAWYYRGITINPEACSPSFSDHWLWTDLKVVPAQELPTYLLEHADEFTESYQTETHLRAQSWLSTIAKTLRQGLLITIDYGFPAKEYYHPQRSQGTLIAHHQHHSIDDLFYLPGLCDLTAHVQWSNLNQVAQAEGLELIAYLSQGAYLLDAGIGELLLANVDMHDPKQFLPQSNALQKLISEAEMGELFKVAAWSMNRLQDKSLDELMNTLPGFRGRMRLL
jgi:SAM-dependent MidA family methyltransferase